MGYRVMAGFIKIHRNILKWGWYSDPATKAVFLHLLLNANYEPGEYKGAKVMPGQAVFGRKAYAEKLGLTERQVRTAMKHLCDTNEISVKSTNKFSIVTIENWALYQSGDDKVTNNRPASDQQVTNNRPASDQQVTTSKKERREEGKKERREELFIRPALGEFENVNLTEEELEKLQERFPYDWQRRLENLSSYMQSKGKRYKSHYATILNWARKDAHNESQKVDFMDL